MTNATKDELTKLQPLPERLELYRRALVELFRWTLWVIVIISVPLIMVEVAHRYFNFSIQPPILALVVLAGALGALLSALTRLYSLRQLPAALLLVEQVQKQNNYLRVFCLVPPVVGMIGAAFFYVLMASEIVKASIFVTFICDGQNQCKGFGGFLSFSPSQPTDYAKAVVWGFVAGFSERLVPDALAGLEKVGKRQ